MRTTKHTDVEMTQQLKDNLVNELRHTLGRGEYFMTKAFEVIEDDGVVMYRLPIEELPSERCRIMLVTPRETYDIVGTYEQP